MRWNKLDGNFIVVLSNSLVREKTKTTAKMFVTLLELHFFTWPLFPITESRRASWWVSPRKPPWGSWELSGKLGSKWEAGLHSLVSFSHHRGLHNPWKDVGRTTVPFKFKWTDYSSLSSFGIWGVWAVAVAGILSTWANYGETWG